MPFDRNLTIAGYVLCAFGGVLFIFMLLGLFGSSYSNQCLLGSYVTCLIVILLVKVSYVTCLIVILLVKVSNFSGSTKYVQFPLYLALSSNLHPSISETRIKRRLFLVTISHIRSYFHRFVDKNVFYKY